MRLARFSMGGTDRVGVVDPAAEVVLDATPVLREADLTAALVDWPSARAELSGALDKLERLPLGAVEFRAPFPRPVRNIFCVGKNYTEHAREFGQSGYDMSSAPEEALPSKPIIFSKATTAVAGPYDDVDPHHGVTKELDYEGELAVIIGVGGKKIRQEDALEHVWGYTIINDVTARDLQRDHKQWLLGKSLDTHCPMGPWATTRDLAGPVEDMVLTTCVNGERRQQASLSQLIFDVPTLISTISSGTTLLPGDLIATGTPAGVGIGFDPPRFLKPGDIVEVTISTLGSIRNRIL